MTRDPARRGVRPLATAVATIVTTLVVTTLRGPAGLRPVPGLVAGVVLLGAGLWRLRQRRASPLGGTAVVVGASVAALAVRAWVDPRGADLDLLLAILGALFAAAGLLRNDRRLVLVGVGQWVFATARPVAGATTFRHCLVATDVAVPLPRLDATLALGAALLAVGLGLRVAGRARDGARGFELAGLATGLTVLVLKATQLDGLRMLCGNGDAVDEWWAVAALLAGAAVAAFGLSTRDAAWAVAGLLTILAAGAFGSLLSRSPVWALLAAIPLVATLVALERRGIAWPHHLGYVRAWPGGGPLPFDDPHEPRGEPVPPVGSGTDVGGDASPHGSDA